MWQCYCLKSFYSWSPIAEPGQLADQTACLLSHLSVAWSCLVSQACVHVCVCVRVKNRITSADLRVCACLTFVLWLVIAGNPSTSQSKKTIKQRFLKLLPCCKPSAAPSISQSKCSFTLYTSLLPSVSPDSSVKTHADTCGWMQSHTHTATAKSLHINPHTETHSALKHCGIIASYWSELLSYSGI